MHQQLVSWIRQAKNLDDDEQQILADYLEPMVELWSPYLETKISQCTSDMIPELEDLFDDFAALPEGWQKYAAAILRETLSELENLMACDAKPRIAKEGERQTAMIYIPSRSPKKYSRPRRASPTSGSSL